MREKLRQKYFDVDKKVIEKKNCLLFLQYLN